MTTRRNPLGELTTLAAADDLNGAAVTMDVTGAAGVIIIQSNAGTAGTLGVDIIEFSRDGGTQWKVATAANIGQGHSGLLLEDGTAAAASGAALNAAGVEPTGAAIFSLGPVDGPFMIRCGRGGSGEAGTAWTTGAPAVVAIRIG
jgi:hypothetical protein